MAAIGPIGSSSYRENNPYRGAAAILAEILLNLKQGALTIPHVESREQLRKLMSEVDLTFRQIQERPEDARVEVAQALWAELYVEWEGMPCLQMEKALQEILNVFSILRSARFCDEEEEKTDTTHILEEFHQALKDKNLLSLQNLLLRPEALAITPSDGYELLKKVLDFPESYFVLEPYVHNIPSQMFLDLLTYGVQNRKWDGVQLLLGPAIRLLAIGDLAQLQEALPADSPEIIKKTLGNMRAIRDAQSQEEAWLTAIHAQDFDMMRALLQTTKGSPLHIRGIVEAAYECDILEPFLLNLFSCSAECGKWEVFTVERLCLLERSSLLKLQNLLPTDTTPPLIRNRVKQAIAAKGEPDEEKTPEYGQELLDAVRAQDFKRISQVLQPGLPLSPERIIQISRQAGLNKVSEELLVILFSNWIKGNHWEALAVHIGGSQLQPGYLFQLVEQLPPDAPEALREIIRDAISRSFPD